MILLGYYDCSLEIFREIGPPPRVLELLCFGVTQGAFFDIIKRTVIS